MDSDDEGSVATEHMRTDNSCGACRTRESETWWKAPKALALATNVLCDNCGISWRKYADLNVRPFRDETISKVKPAEKREGTPLAAPNSKRPRVSSLYRGLLRRVDRSAFCLSDICLDVYASACRCASGAMLGLPQEWTGDQNTPMSTMPIPRPSW